MKILLVFSFIVCLCSCNQPHIQTNNVDLELAQVDSCDSIFLRDSIFLMVKNCKHISPTDTIEVEIFNNTDSIWVTGQYFKIEKKNNTNWCPVPLAPGVFYDIGYEIGPYKSRMFKIDLNRTNDTLSSGTYRVSKLVTSNGHKRFVSDEITVE